LVGTSTAAQASLGLHRDATGPEPADA
jgi:hypothetical protein